MPGGDQGRLVHASFRRLAVCCAVTLIAAAPPGPPRGYTPAAAVAERASELRFLDIPSAQGALDHATVIGARPHYAGTDGDRQLAQYTAGKLTEYGFTTRIEPFSTIVELPVHLALEIVPSGPPAPAARPFHRRPPHSSGFDLREGTIDGDAATANPEIGLPFLSGSADGDVTGPIVYANRGVDADYETLRAAGVAVRGAVVVVRYGARFRGQLVGRAQREGAAAVVLYSDPADDGARRGPVYPEGPWRPASSVQRGSLGEGIRIPALPISANNAQTLLAALHGPPGPAGWRGGLDVEYPVTRGPAVANVVVQLRRKPTTLWNVVGHIDGRHTDENVILGAHRDAWVYGVGDNGAGTATLLEIARGLGYLAHSGWRPERTLSIALWDGEEIGLRGSRAYVAAHAHELGGLVAYLNADEIITGQRFAASAVPALAGTIVEATREVPDPGRERSSLYERWRVAAAANEPVAATPGGGSDHEPFLFDLGVPVIEGMAFEGPFGPYHSVVDDLRYATTQSDPGFTLHRSAALLYGIAAMRLADATSAPYAYAPYAVALRDGLARIRAGAPVSEDFSPLVQAIERFAAIARAADRRPMPIGKGIEAVRSLDRLAFGASGYASVAFPELTLALQRGDHNATVVAIARAIGSLSRASAALSP